MRKTIIHTALALSAAITAASAVAAPPEGRFFDVIVSLDADTGSRPGNRAFAASVANEHAINARHTFGTVFTGFAARVPEAVYNRLQDDPLVASISFDGIATTMAPPPGKGPGGGGGGGGGSTTETIPWGVDRIGALTASNNGAGVHVYVIDTGIDATHPDLAGNLGNGFAAASCRGGKCDAAWDDDNGHGSHVAGTIGAIDNEIDVIGVAPGVTLHAVKVLDSRGSGSFSDIIAGVDWVAAEVAARGAPAVANMSLGGGGSKSGTCTSSGFTGTDNMHRAICNAKNVGVVFAVAAGNEGADASGSVPAAYDDAVIAVSATTSGDDWPNWSNWGNDSAAWTSATSAPVAIAAPGVSILSTWNDGSVNTISGTSMASPHTAGALALWLGASSQGANATAFTNGRSALLGGAESTAGFSNTSGFPHDEPFLNARGF